MTLSLFAMIIDYGQCYLAVMTGQILNRDSRVLGMLCTCGSDDLYRPRFVRHDDHEQRSAIPKIIGRHYL